MHSDQVGNISRPERSEHATHDPLQRISRLRRNPAARAMLTETVVRPDQLVLPLFITHDPNAATAISSLPGQQQLGIDRLADTLDDAVSSGVRSVLLFGIPRDKDDSGSAAWSASGPVPTAIAAIKRRTPELLVMADVCLCEYTSHGHCGMLDTRQCIDTTSTLPLLARTAVAYADAGADIIAPSAMVDGQVATIRRALDDAGHQDVAILSYSSKFASAFYGPFREAVASAPSSGDRSAHQLPAPNLREALRESARDEAEGADMLMVKPAGAYLDIIAQLRHRTSLPIAAYQVSGEYAMIKAAAERGWIDERRVVLESLTAIRRAGADVIISYYASLAARWLRDERAGGAA